MIKPKEPKPKPVKKPELQPVPLKDFSAALKRVLELPKK
jgi:hypothetical protein